MRKTRGKANSSSSRKPAGSLERRRLVLWFSNFQQSANKLERGLEVAGNVPIFLKTKLFFRPTFGFVEGINFKYWKLALNALWCLQPQAAQHSTTSPSEESMRNRVLVTASFSVAKLPPICGNQLRKAKKPGVARSETAYLSVRSWCPSWKEGKLSNHAP